MCCLNKAREKQICSQSKRTRDIRDTNKTRNKYASLRIKSQTKETDSIGHWTWATKDGW